MKVRSLLLTTIVVLSNCLSQVQPAAPAPAAAGRGMLATIQEKFGWPTVYQSVIGAAQKMETHIGVPASIGHAVGVSLLHYYNDNQRRGVRAFFRHFARNTALLQIFTVVQDAINNEPLLADEVAAMGGGAAFKEIVTIIMIAVIFNRYVDCVSVCKDAAIYMKDLVVYAVDCVKKIFQLTRYVFNVCKSMHPGLRIGVLAYIAGIACCRDMSALCTGIQAFWSSTMGPLLQPAATLRDFTQLWIIKELAAPANVILREDIAVILNCISEVWENRHELMTRGTKNLKIVTCGLLFGLMRLFNQGCSVTAEVFPSK